MKCSGPYMNRRGGVSGLLRSHFHLRRGEAGGPLESLVPASFQCSPWNGTGSSVGCCNLILKCCTSEAQRVLHGGSSWRQRLHPSITHHGHFLGASVLSSVQCEPSRYGCCVEKQPATPPPWQEPLRCVGWGGGEHLEAGSHPINELSLKTGQLLTDAAARGGQSSESRSRGCSSCLPAWRG